MALGGLQTERFDPVVSPPMDATSIDSPIFDFLVRIDKDQKKIPGVADSWSIAADGLSWTFNIHKGIKFSNGDDLTSADVKFSLDRYSGSTAFGSELRDNVSRVEVVDQYTVRIVTKSVQPYIPDYLTMVAPRLGVVLPKTYFEKVGADTFASRPIGSGPFKLASQGPGDYIQYEAVPNHWRMTASFKTLSLIAMPEEQTRVASLKTGSVELAEVSLDSSPALQALGFQMLKGDSQMTSVQISGAYHPDAKAMPLSDVRVRQALSNAINRGEINQTIFQGIGDPPNAGRIQPGTTDVDMVRWNKWVTDNYQFDTAKSKKLLADAGYANGFSGLKLYFVVSRAAAHLPKVAEVLQSYWKQVGVNVDLLALDEVTYKAIRAAPDKSLIGQAVVTELGPNPLSVTSFRVGYANSGKGYRLFSTGPTTSAITVDPLLSQIDAEPDAAKRSALLDQLIAQTVDTYVFLEIGALPRLTSYNGKLQLLPGYPKEEPAAQAEFYRLK
jgi:peptide/nickel transport system substrate-binding protein